MSNESQDIFLNSLKIDIKYKQFQNQTMSQQFFHKMAKI